MATKYLIHGAAFCGDGTASNEAASAGAPGAWNDINVMEGTAPAYGSAPAAGDIIRIRSKTSAGADITRTLAASTSLGSTAATAPTAPIYWVLDGGATWPGVDGTLTYKRTSGAYVLTFRAYNVFLAESEDHLVFADEWTGANGGQNFISNAASSSVQNAWFDFDNVTFTSAGPQPILLATGSEHANCRYSVNNRWYLGFFVSADGGYSRIISPRIEIASVFGAYGVFGFNANGCRIEVHGGYIGGAGATTGTYLTSTTGTNNGHNLVMLGTVVPKTMGVMVANPAVNGAELSYEGLGIDSDLGAMRVTKGGFIDSRSDGFYPTLNATYPGASSPKWAWKAYPQFASIQHPMVLPFTKFYSEAAAAKTITLNLLVGDAFSAANKGSVWFDVCYIDDATGMPKYVSTRNQLSSAVLDTSAAPWSATTYGAINLLKRQIAITTPTAIRQNSLITCFMRCIARSVSANDIMFVCPDPVLT